MGRVRIVGVVAAGVLVFTLGLSTLLAQDQPQKKPGQPDVQAKEVTLTGKIVDLHCLMAGGPEGKEGVKCSAKCLMEGVPAALETDSGIVLLGKGLSGIGREASRHALTKVEVKGRLYEKYGLKYVDVTSIQKVKETESEGEEEDWPDEPEPDAEP